MLIKNQHYDQNSAVHALNIASYYAKDAVTPEQKAWVIDQMVRALTSCPLVMKEVITTRGDVLEVEMLGENSEYLVIANQPGWDKGIPI
jgi:methionyl-tRNA formyltransferase